jgi:hypothetical protein
MADLSMSQIREKQQLREQLAAARQRANHWQAETFKIVYDGGVLDETTMTREEYKQYMRPNTPTQHEREDEDGMSSDGEYATLVRRHTKPRYRNLTEYIQGKAAVSYEIRKARTGEIQMTENTYRISEEDADKALAMLTKAKAEATELAQLSHTQDVLQEKVESYPYAGVDEAQASEARVILEKAGGIAAGTPETRLATEAQPMAA